MTQCNTADSGKLREADPLRIILDCRKAVIDMKT